MLQVAFPTLTHLIKLDLSKNKLKELPTNFGDLFRLRQLDLYSNEVNNAFQVPVFALTLNIFSCKGFLSVFVN